ncbi:hypothetical protein HK100_010112 [Physocladia obscura]|uniref:Uncharacterized protein n=1 Tax=Physocladia obscura TaxID=109957 RepID=A0AAD5XHQ6_9FUNG|nr:hypothetical protein HK100_010112 [Physocladia obscura]
MFQKLSNLVDDGLIESQDSVDEAVVELNDTVNLKTDLIFSSIMAVLSYVPVPLSSASFATSESHCKIELWVPIFSAAFKINQSRMNSVWELLHPIPGNGGTVVGI